jgi:hypothetical protein
MNSLKQVTVLSLYSLLTVVGAIGSATEKATIAPQCQARPVEDPLVKGRARWIRFPDGRVVVVVGHMHGERQIYSLRDLLERGKIQTMSNENFARLFKNILIENSKPLESELIKSVRQKKMENLERQGMADLKAVFKDTHVYDLKNVTVINHAQEDAAYLSKLVSTGVIRFSGYEGSEKVLLSNYPRYLETYRLIWREFFRRQAIGKLDLSQQELTAALQSATNGHVDLYLKTSGLMRSVPMIGVEENEKLEEFMVQGTSPLERMEAAWKKVTKADDIHVDRLSDEEKREFMRNPMVKKFGVLLFSIYSGVSSRGITSLEEFRTQVQRLQRYSTFPWMKEPLKELIQAMEDHVRYDGKRERYQAENLAGLRATGVDFVGLNHLYGIVRNLEQICSEEILSKNVVPGTTYGYGNGTAAR